MLPAIILTSFLTLISPSTEPVSMIDSDQDGLSDHMERTVYYTDASKADTDNDGYTDKEELDHGYSPRHADGVKLMAVDSDKDYLNDAWELIIGTGLMDHESRSFGGPSIAPTPKPQTTLISQQCLVANGRTAHHIQNTRALSVSGHTCLIKDRFELQRNVVHWLFFSVTGRCKGALIHW